MKSLIQCPEDLELLEMIEAKKNLLTTKALEYGFTHEETLEVSQQLDALLNRYQFNRNFHDQSIYSI